MRVSKAFDYVSEMVPQVRRAFPAQLVQERLCRLVTLGHAVSHIIDQLERHYAVGNRQAD